MDRLDVKRVQAREAVAESVGSDAGSLTVSQMMTSAPSCIGPEATALELVRMFHVKQFRHLLVVDASNRLLGVISDRDVIRCFGPDRAPNRTVLAEISAAELMSSDLVTVQPNTSLAQAATLMIEQGISCLPVLAGDTLVGILTNTDLHLVLLALLQSTAATTYVTTTH